MQPERKSPPSRSSTRIPPLPSTSHTSSCTGRHLQAKSDVELSDLQKEIETILGKGGFQIKYWERSDENGSSKYLGMTWDRLQDHYLLKFCLNLYKKSHGIPSRANLDSEFLQDHSTLITKKNILSVACQFYDPTGLAAPLPSCSLYVHFSVKSIRIIWIDSGLNIVKAGKDLINTKIKVILDLNIKFESIEFRVTLPKHHTGIGAVEES